MQVLSSKVRLPRLKSIAIIGTTRRSADCIRPTVDRGLSNFAGCAKVIF